MLLKRKKLSKISSVPGKTQLINHFMINEKIYFVDLPVYGWAKTSKSNRKKWDDMTKHFLINSKNLSLIFILIDIRIPPQKIDIDYINFIGKNNLPVNLIFTKCDKIKKISIKNNIGDFLNELNNYWSPPPDYFISSSQTLEGREEILSHIHEIIK